MSRKIFPRLWFSYFVLDKTPLILYNIKMKKQSKAWTMKECDVLRKKYNEVSMEELKEMLPGRNENSIYKKVQYLRKKGWIIRRSRDGN